MNDRNRVSWKLGLAYGLPNFGLAIMVGPVMGIIQGYYTRNFNITLAQIGGVLLLARVFDAVSDPTVGIVSDHLRKRFWGRRSWLVAGTVISLLAIYHLFLVPDGVRIEYIRLWLLMGFLGWTIAEIPYLAWGTEITSDYDGRTKIFSFKGAMGFVGCFVFLSLPLIIAWYQTTFLGTPEADVTRDYSHLSMKVSFWVLAMAMPVFVLIALLVCPDGSHIKKPERKGIFETVRILVSNRAMLIFTGAFVILGIAGGMQVAMAYLHVTVYLGLGEHVSQIYVVGFLCSLAGIPVWSKLASSGGKHVSFVVGLSISCLMFIGLGLMQPHKGDGLFWGKPPVFWWYLLVFCGCNFSQVVYYVMPPAIIGDISDSAMLETREDQSATYYSVYTFMYKMALGLGTALAMFLADKAFGFDPKAVKQVDDAALGIKIIMGYLPAALLVFAVALIWFYPITKAKYEEIQAKIKELGLREGDLSGADHESQDRDERLGDEQSSGTDEEQYGAGR